MTFEEAYIKGKDILNSFNIPDYSFDTMCIFENVFNIKRQDLCLCKNESVPKDKENLFFDLIDKRKKHTPLQYILGKWNFMGSIFKVGEGVLIPRDDTEVLVNVSAQKLRDYIKNNSITSPLILDLCSGSGIIAITLAKLFPKANVFALEFSDAALSFLNENIGLNNVKNVIPLKFDVLKSDFTELISKVKVFNNFATCKFDLIVSNPPYIKSSDIPILQLEVQKEPSMALDGGVDGLRFYRSILNNWSALLKENASLCVEIGFDQKRSAVELFKKANFKNIETFKDINNLDRVVAGLK